MVNAQSNNCYADTIFNIRNEEMYLNTDKYKEVILKKDSTIIINKNFEVRFIVLSNGIILNVKSDKKLGIQKNITYSPNGKIQNVNFNNYQGESSIYKELNFNEKGEIISTLNYDKGYSICWSEAIEICKKLVGKKAIKKYAIQEFIIMNRIDLNKYPNDKATWFVRPIAQGLNGKGYDNDSENKYFLHNKGNLWFHIDGADGKLVGKSIHWTEDGYLTKVKQLKIKN